MKLLALFAVVAIAAAAFALLTRGSSATGARVERVVDGDTIALVDGTRVRLVQIDTPEKGAECYGNEASELTSRLLPPGTKVRIEQDPALDQVDRYHRKLAYVFKDDEDVNLSLVEQGAAGVWFFDGDHGRYAGKLLRAAEEARSEHKGLWGACPLAVFDPTTSLSTGPS